MSANQSIVYSMFAMVVLTVIVSTVMLKARIADAKVNKIHPQKQATSELRRASGESAKAIQVHDNYRNLFEANVLFYVLAVSLLATQTTTSWILIGLWVYVALRYLHSFIHSTYNNVMHRFPIFMLSFGLLIVMWVAFVMGVN